MARQIDEFVMAWGALAGISDMQGWRSISVAPAGSCTLMAGRRFPGNHEALLAGFSEVSLPFAENLPAGNGFEVCRADPHGDGRSWIALTRRESGSLDLFTEMVADVAGALDAINDEGEDKLLRVFLLRIRSWQEFMRHGLQALSPEAEIGLVGELFVLGSIIECGVPAALAVEAWVGPLEGIQDFELGTGAVEVKATLSSQGFPIKIDSLEQLDDSLRKPLFLAGAQFAQRESGMNLPEFAAFVRSLMAGDNEALRVYEDRLLAAGFLAAHSDRYSRRFMVDKTKIVEVSNGFPRLVPGAVPAAIRRATYEIDFSQVAEAAVDMKEALKRLGVL